MPVRRPAGCVGRISGGSTRTRMCLSAPFWGSIGCLLMLFQAVGKLVVMSSEFEQPVPRLRQLREARHLQELPGLLAIASRALLGGPGYRVGVHSAATMAAIYDVES